MAQQTRRPPATVQTTSPELVASVMEGNRWLHNPPDPGDVAAWFKNNAPVHDDLDPSHYVNGVTLIPAEEKIKRTILDGNGNPQIQESKRMTFTPYIKVETRVAYFWDWCRKLGYIGEIEAAPIKRTAQAGYFNENLPPGFFITYIGDGGPKNKRMLCCSMQVRVYEPNLRSGGKGRLVMAPPGATKAVDMFTYEKPDPLAVMKAETGAVGRALGMGGFLVLPGSGVATAEDVQEAMAGTSTGAGDAGVPAEETAAAADPLDSTVSSDQRARMNDLRQQIEAHPVEADKLDEWCSQRGIDINNVEDSQLRSVIRQMEARVRAIPLGQDK